jgi:hypothetical protein
VSALMQYLIALLGASHFLSSGEEAFMASSNLQSCFLFSWELDSVGGLDYFSHGTRNDVACPIDRF